MYCRKINNVKTTIIKKKFDLVLKKNNAIKKIKFNSFSFCIIDIKKAFNLMVDDIRKKKGCIVPIKYD